MHLNEIRTMPFGFGARFKLAFSFGSIEGRLLKIQIFCMDAVLMVTWFTGQTEGSNVKQHICLSVSINKTTEFIHAINIHSNCTGLNLIMCVYTQK
jgi:hypothetical protein